MLKVEFSNKTRKYKVNEKLLTSLVRKISHFAGEDYGIVSISFVGEKRIRNINKKFRGIDKPTNVISFPFMDSFGKIKIIGDIVICLQIAKKQAKKEGNNFTDYVAFLIIHAFLHLLGYDHIEEKDRVIMEKKEEEIFHKIHITNFLKEAGK